MAPVSPVQEEMKQWTGEEKHIGQCAEEMGPVLGEQEKTENGQKGTEQNRSQ